jgi:predicted TIM-barrel fold metal-dependent hydrolase
MSEAATLFSADSHVIEPPSVWKGALEPSFWPGEGKMFQERAGGQDPAARLQEMGVDGVFAEVLYPSLGLKLFGIDDAALQETTCRMYNQWLIDFCKLDPSKLMGIGLIPAYDIDKAVQELEFCYAGGLKGLMVWQSPHPDLPFTSNHYDRLWGRAQELRMPLSVHILTGFNYSREMLEDVDKQDALTSVRGSVNLKLLAVVDTAYEFIFGGVFERFPNLKLVLVENEVGWFPFVLDQWDYYYHRTGKVKQMPIPHPPSHYVDRNVYITFFRDPMTPHLLDWWGTDNCMWSNDYPHGNSTWPNSRQYVADHLGKFSPEIQQKLVRGNAERLYGLVG